MRAADVTIYTTDYCPYCVRAKQLLTQKQARFTEVSVEARDDLRDWLRQASGQRTVPQVFINGKSVGGFSELAALDGARKLEPLLDQGPSEDAPALPR
jgi:glutaredoxin 3